jgi:hypothetical protein
MLELVRTPTSRCQFAGLRVEIYRSAVGWDATNGGISSVHSDMAIYLEAAVARADDDVLVLVKHRNGLRAVPYSLWHDRRWVMFGGNFCFTSDSRFPSDQPIKVFDRVEEGAA